MDTASWQRASQVGICADVIFVRRDGWMLGATYEMAVAGRRLWQGRWVACLNLRNSQVFFIKEGKQ